MDGDFEKIEKPRKGKPCTPPLFPKVKRRESVVALGLTEEQEDELLEAFLLYDRDEDGFIDTKQLGEVIRSLGRNPTEKELADIVCLYAQEKCGQINFRAFLSLMAPRLEPFDDEDELRESFRRFDKPDAKVLTLRQLRLMLTTRGEPISKDEFDSWIGDGLEFLEANQSLRYEDMATMMLTK